MNEFKLPQEFCERMELTLGDECEAFLKSLDSSSFTSVRLNKHKPADIFENEEKVPWSSSGFYLAERPVFTLDPLLHAGCYYVQEASSMFLEEAIRQAVDLKKQLKVLDLCAAPGGKSTLIASLISSGSLLVANEVIKSRVSVLQENLIKWGLPNVVITSNDANDFKKLSEFFDVIIADVPCSGEGLFRKDIKAREEWSESNVDHCAVRQRRIMEDISEVLKPGGILIYSTCTYSTVENEENIQWLSLKEGFTSLKLDIEKLDGIVGNGTNGIYTYRFYPHKIKGEGFFISCLQKPVEDSSSVRHKITSPLQRVPKNIETILKPWLKNGEHFDFFYQEENILAVLKGHVNDLGILKSNLYIRQAGIEMGKIIGKELIPAHALALSIELNEEINTLELEYKDALAYLRKEAIQITPEETGWKIIKYKGHPLGWIKALGNRVNNYYPKEWKIRMKLPE